MMGKAPENVMSRKIKYSLAVLSLVALTAVVCGLLWRGKETADGEDDHWEKSAVGVTSEGANRIAGSTLQSAKKAGDADVADAVEEGGDEPQAEEEPQTEEERREAAEAALVDAFDDLTDKWTEESERGVSMADVDKFAALFRKVPADRRDECLHRALNLIPDENVMLLAGILMDKTLGQETAETVFNDILNRDEEVKKPILQQVFKDKAHPCWEDAAWILDVTDELPKQDKKP